MGELSPWHWLVVIGVAVLLFGAKRLPDAARSLGRSARILQAELRAGTAPAATEPSPEEPATDSDENGHPRAAAPDLSPAGHGENEPEDTRPVAR